MISKGDYFIVTKSADGKSVAIPASIRTGVEGDKFFPVSTADGFKVPFVVSGKPLSEESFISVNSADGERVAVPFVSLGGSFRDLNVKYKIYINPYYNLSVSENNGLYEITSDNYITQRTLDPGDYVTPLYNQPLFKVLAYKDVDLNGDLINFGQGSASVPMPSPSVYQSSDRLYITSGGFGRNIDGTCLCVGKYNNGQDLIKQTFSISETKNLANITYENLEGDQQISTNERYDVLSIMYPSGANSKQQTNPQTDNLSNTDSFQAVRYGVIFEYNLIVYFQTGEFSYDEYIGNMTPEDKISIDLNGKYGLIW